MSWVSRLGGVGWAWVGVGSEASLPAFEIRTESFYFISALFFFFFNKIYLFFWLCQVLVAAGGLLSCGM